MIFHGSSRWGGGVHGGEHRGKRQIFDDLWPAAAVDYSFDIQVIFLNPLPD